MLGLSSTLKFSRIYQSWLFQNPISQLLMHLVALAMVPIVIAATVLIAPIYAIVKLCTDPNNKKEPRTVHIDDFNVGAANSNHFRVFYRDVPEASASKVKTPTEQKSSGFMHWFHRKETEKSKLTSTSSSQYGKLLSPTHASKSRYVDHCDKLLFTLGHPGHNPRPA